MRYKEDRPEVIKGTITNPELQEIIDNEFEFFDNRAHIGPGDIRFFRGVLAAVSVQKYNAFLYKDLETLIKGLENCGINGLEVER
jgi:hypothetical protein